MSNKQKSKFPLAAIFFGLMTIACTVVRYFQYKNVISVATGFFDHEGGFAAHSYYVLLAAFLLIMTALAVIDNKSRRGIVSGKNLKAFASGEQISGTQKSEGFLNRKLGFLTSFIGLIIFFAAGFLFALQAIWVFGDGGTSVSLKVALFAASLGYTYVGFTAITQKKVIPTAAIAFLFIATYNIADSAAVFMRKVYVHHISAELIALLTGVALTLFFLSCGRIVVQSQTRLTAVTATVFGYAAVLLAVSDGFARIMYFFYYSSHIHFFDFSLIDADNGYERPSLLFFSQAAAVIWLIFALSAKKRGLNNNEEDETEQTEENQNTINTENEKNENIEEVQTGADSADGGIAD